MNPKEYLTKNKVDYMKNVAMKLCGDRFLSEDLVQSCCLFLLKHNSQFHEHKAKLKTFLYKVVKNEYINKKRKKKYYFIEIEPEHSIVYPSLDHNIDIKKCFNIIKKKIDKQKFDNVYLQYVENIKFETSNEHRKLNNELRKIKKHINYFNTQEIKSILRES